MADVHVLERRKRSTPFMVRWIAPAIVMGIATAVLTVMSLDVSGSAYAEDEPVRSIAIVLLGPAMFVIPVLGELPRYPRDAAIALTTVAYWALLFAPIRWGGQSRRTRLLLRLSKYALVVAHLGIACLFIWFVHVWLVDFSANFSPGGEF